MKQPTALYSFEPSPETLKKMKDFYRPFQSDNDNPYIDLFAKNDAVAVTIYKQNKKGKIKVVFQGPDAIKEAKIWDLTARDQNLPKKEKAEIKNIYPQIGSDEVGTGDFFGPVCVCATYIQKKDLPLLEELGVTDSKKMSDEHILAIGPTLLSKIEYSQLSLPNEKYNEVKDDFNMNVIKAKMHNRCLLNLHRKHPKATLYQDQFAEPGQYFSYLKNEAKVVTKINFHTKGESLFPSVAAGSVIARYSFLKKMQAMNERYGMEFPFGAGEKVDAFIEQFIERYGKEELRKVAKLNWANYKRLK